MNKDLADVLGNFVNRVTKFAAARFGDAVPDGGAYGPAEEAVVGEIARRVAAYEAHLDAIELRKAAQELRAIWAAGNEFLQAAAPWTAIKTDRDRAAAIVRFSLNLIRLLAVLSRPFLPDASDAMLAALGLEAADWPDDSAPRSRRCRPGTVSRCQRCCSPRSTTAAPPRSPPASPGADRPPGNGRAAVALRRTTPTSEVPSDGREDSPRPVL